jgi:hypothetical protein
LACIKEQSVPVSVVWFVTAHTCQDYASGFSLLFHVSDCFHCPVSVVSVSVRVLSYGDGVGWAEGYASLTVNTVLFLTADNVGFFIVEVGVVGALVNANFAAYATLLVSFNEVFGY